MSHDDRSTTTRVVAYPGGVLGGGFRWISIGMCALILLSAFESLAVTTVMPLISAELNGQNLYALAFAGPLAVSVVGMVIAGNWSDRGGPRAPLYASVALFALGLIVAGTADNMWTLVAGRLIHGLGGGGLIVALYVIVARVYPAVLQPRIFAGFAAAWVVPSLVGPFLAGVVADSVGWPWVFLGVVGLAVVAMIMVLPAMRGIESGEAAESASRAGGANVLAAGSKAADDSAAVSAGFASETGEGESPVEPVKRMRPSWSLARISWAVLAAVSVLALNLSAEASGILSWLIPIVAITLLAIALRPLLPVGTLRASTGLPSVVLFRGLIGGSFFGAEVYVPYLLTEEYRLTPSMAGLALTVGGLAWATGSQIQGRLTAPEAHLLCIRLGMTLLGVSLAVTVTATILGLPAAVLIAGWTLAGGGMGFMFPRTSVMTLQASTPDNQGFNSSAIAISDGIGSAVALALTAIIFSLLLPLGGAWSFVGCFALAIAFWLVALTVVPRTTRASGPS